MWLYELKLNPVKYKSLLIGSTQLINIDLNSADIQVDGIQLEWDTSSKNRGTIIYSNLFFDKRVSEICQYSLPN